MLGNSERGVSRLLSSLSVRLLWRLLLTMTVVFVGYALITYQGNTRRWTASIHGFADRTSTLVEQAIHTAMLTNTKDDVEARLQNIARTPDIEHIRIFDKSGLVIFSARPGETGMAAPSSSRTCAICHDGHGSRQETPHSTQMRVFRNGGGQRLLSVVNPLENEPACSTGECHVHAGAGPVLGVLDVTMSMAPMEEALAASQNQVVWLTIVMGLLVGTATVVFVHRVVRGPIRHLYQGTERVAAGDLGTRLPVETRDEVGALAAAFNRMTADLQKAQAELMGWSQKLEEQVEKKTSELGKAQRQILHMEKMAVLGKLSATVAHEINNPLSGILTYAKLVERDIRSGHCDPGDREEMKRYLQLIQSESTRCGEIVKNLLLFARQKGKRFAPVHVREILERVAMLVRHHLEMAGLRLELDLREGDDEILADGDQIQQALIAVIMNAIEAMDRSHGGVLGLGFVPGDHAVEVIVSDTGTGIPEDVLGHIFEPFFSTKNKESGVGLGLAVVYGIVQRHGGHIDVETREGEGTTFHVHLCRRPSDTGTTYEDAFGSGQPAA